MYGLLFLYVSRSLVLSFLIFSFMVHFVQSNNECIFMSIQGTGYHRDVILVTTNNSPDYRNSDIIVFNVTKSLYIDKDEIFMLGGIKMVFYSFIDTEQSAVLSSDHIVHINWRRYIVFPLHLRYHPPSNNLYYNVTVPQPVVQTCQTSLECFNKVKCQINDVIVTVPCGVKDHTHLVVLGTVLVTSLAVVWIIIITSNN